MAFIILSVFRKNKKTMFYKIPAKLIISKNSHKVNKKNMGGWLFEKIQFCYIKRNWDCNVKFCSSPLRETASGETNGDVSVCVCVLCLCVLVLALVRQPAKARWVALSGAMTSPWLWRCCCLLIVQRQGAGFPIANQTNLHTKISKHQAAF